MVVPVVAQFVVAAVAGSLPESSDKVAVIVGAAPFQLAAGTKASSSAARIKTPAVAAVISLSAVHAPPSLVEYFHCPLLVSSVYDVRQTPPIASPSVSAKLLLNRVETVAPDAVASSLMAVKVADPEAVGASFRDATVTVEAIVTDFELSPPLAVPPSSPIAVMVTTRLPVVGLWSEFS